MIRVHEPIAERIPGDQIRIRWGEPAGRAGVSVYIGTDPEEIDRKWLAGELVAGELILRGLDPRTRHYFELIPNNGSPGLVIGERLNPLEGAHNFRDLGGYATRDGRRVRWGMIFRSDHLADLTQPDINYISKLGIRLVCDFRGEEEIAENPNRLPPDDPPEQINPAISGTALAPGDIQAAIMQGNPDKLDFRQLLIDGNRFMATGALDQYRELFRRLEREEFVPLLFHCTAGKDRTGVAAALILLALGVPEETIMEDYLLTATYTHERVEKNLMAVRFASQFRTDLDEVRPIMSVRREFLQAAFDGIHDEYGSVDRYMEQALLLTNEKRDALRRRFLR
ncbi:MAG: tyrosine-protein phosphatase [Deltaproteobacteria bacterium]|nr:tyrosine-protein phosphatase [Deltaproteobacteria bacterium]